MAVGRQVLPLVWLHVVVAYDYQASVVDADFVFVGEDKDLRWRLQLRNLDFIFRGVARVGSVVISVQPPIHRVAACPEESGMTSYNRVVGRTSVDQRAADV